MSGVQIHLEQTSARSRGNTAAGSDQMFAAMAGWGQNSAGESGGGAYLPPGQRWRRASNAIITMQRTASRFTTAARARSPNIDWNEHDYSERRCGRYYENVLVLWAKRWWRRRHQSVNGQTPRQ